MKSNINRAASSTAGINQARFSGLSKKSFLEVPVPSEGGAVVVVVVVEVVEVVVVGSTGDIIINLRYTEDGWCNNNKI